MLVGYFQTCLSNHRFFLITCFACNTSKLSLSSCVIEYSGGKELKPVIVNIAYHFDYGNKWIFCASGLNNIFNLLTIKYKKADAPIPSP